MREKTDLLIIDPQVDFCDPNGALFVPGADADMVRLAGMIDRYGSKIRSTHVTLDCHYVFDVAHAPMWINSKGQNPPPFTIISASDIKEGKWVPVFPVLRQEFINYCEALEKTSRKYPLIVWPTHCVIGSYGNAVLPVLNEALMKWQLLRKDNIDFVSKGSDPRTEHYSAVRAEVPRDDNPETQINTRFLNLFVTDEVETILCAGEAGSHCYKNTIEDIVDWFKTNAPRCIQKMVMLVDAVSPVPKIGNGPDFPAIQEKFIKDMKALGLRTAKTTDF